MFARNLEIADQVLRDLAQMNIGEGTPVPAKTIWLRTRKYGGVRSEELQAAMSFAIEAAYLTFCPGGICGQGSFTMTAAGYSRDL